MPPAEVFRVKGTKTIYRQLRTVIKTKICNTQQHFNNILRRRDLCTTERNYIMNYLEEGSDKLPPDVWKMLMSHKRFIVYSRYESTGFWSDVVGHIYVHKRINGMKLQEINQFFLEHPDLGGACIISEIGDLKGHNIQGDWIDILLIE